MVLCMILPAYIQSSEYNECHLQVLGRPFDGNKVADYTKDVQYVCVYSLS